MQNIKRILFLFFSTLIATQAFSDQSLTEYEIEKDEFGYGEVHRVSIATNDTSTAVLMISCFSSENLQIQLHTDKTIFPNGLKNGSMWLQVTHKIDSAADAHTKSWQMNMMKYNDAWLLNDVEDVLKEMLAGEKLSMKLDKAGTIYRFALKEAKPHIQSVIVACK